MNSFNQKPSRPSQKQAIDGILNAPVNRGRGVQAGRPLGRRPVQQTRLEPAAGTRPQRLIGDFSKKEGYHSADPTKAGRVGGRSTPSQLEKQFVPPKRQSTPPRRAGLKKRKPRRAWKTWALRGSIASFVVVVALTGFLVTKGYLKLNQIFKGGGAAVALDADVDPSKLKGEGDGRVNILLMGRGGAGHDGPDLTDTVLVASIDPVNKKAGLVSIPRDLWVESKYGDSKINAVFANAKSSALRRDASVESAEKTGIEAIENVTEEVLGLNIHYYTMVDFKAFEKAVNTVGGVNINVPEELRDSTMAWENNWNPVIAKQGPQRMDAKKALMYVRSRHGSARGDFDRAERQRLFIIALKSEILSKGTFSNPVKVSRLMDDFGNNVKTDFSLNDLMRLYNLGKGIKDKNVKSIDLALPPNDFLTTGSYAGQSVVIPKDGAFEYDALKTYVRSQLPDGYLAKEKAPITVLNGSTADGIATVKADELKSYGYNVTKVDTAERQDFTQTIIVDLTGKNKYTKNYLEKRYGVKVTRTVPGGITISENQRKGFVIIIGSNEATNR